MRMKLGVRADSDDEPEEDCENDTVKEEFTSTGEDDEVGGIAFHVLLGHR